MWACFSGYANVVRTFLDRDVHQQIDLDAQCTKGETALITAVRNNRSEVVKILLTARMYAIDPHLPDEKGLSAVDYARISDQFIQSYFTSGLKAIQATRVTFRRHVHLLLDDLPPVLCALVCDYLFRTF